MAGVSGIFRDGIRIMQGGHDGVSFDRNYLDSRCFCISEDGIRIMQGGMMVYPLIGIV